MWSPGIAGQQLEVGLATEEVPCVEQDPAVGTAGGAHDLPARSRAIRSAERGEPRCTSTPDAGEAVADRGEPFRERVGRLIGRERGDDVDVAHPIVWAVRMWSSSVNAAEVNQAGAGGWSYHEVTASTMRVLEASVASPVEHFSAIDALGRERGEVLGPDRSAHGTRWSSRRRCAVERRRAEHRRPQHVSRARVRTALPEAAEVERDHVTLETLPSLPARAGCGGVDDHAPDLVVRGVLVGDAADPPIAVDGSSIWSRVFQSNVSTPSRYPLAAIVPVGQPSPSITPTTRCASPRGSRRPRRRSSRRHVGRIVGSDLGVSHDSIWNTIRFSDSSRREPFPRPRSGPRSRRPHRAADGDINLVRSAGRGLPVQRDTALGSSGSRTTQHTRSSASRLRALATLRYVADRQLAVAQDAGHRIAGRPTIRPSHEHEYDDRPVARQERVIDRHGSQRPWRQTGGSRSRRPPRPRSRNPICPGVHDRVGRHRHEHVVVVGVADGRRYHGVRGEQTGRPASGRGAPSPSMRSWWSALGRDGAREARDGAEPLALERERSGVAVEDFDIVPRVPTER